MIAEEFMTHIRDMNANDQANNIVKFNSIIKQLETRADAETASNFFSNMKEISDKHIRAIKKDSFAWNKDIGTDIKNFFSKFKDLRSPLFLGLANTRFLSEVFPVSYFYSLASVNLGRVGGSLHYDESLRALSNLLRFFINAYLKKGLAFKPSLKSHSMHIHDPCYREKVRERNLNDEEIQNLFFTSEFDLKSFVFLCLDKYFPNVSWRWLGGQQFAHYMTLKIVLVLFEYGLWRLEELDVLLTRIYSVSEILCTLETNIDKDSRSSAYYFAASQMDDWTVLCTKCRKKIGSIFLHIITMYMDREVMSALPEFHIPVNGALAGQLLFEPEQRTRLENLFYVKRFKKKKLYTYFAYSLVTYLIRPMQFNRASEPVGSQSLNSIISVLMGNVSEIENNFFNISLNTFQNEAVSFYLLSKDSSVATFPANYVERFKEIIKKVQQGEYGAIDAQNAAFFNDICEIFSQITSYLKTHLDNIEVFYANQIAFLLLEVPHYILCLLDFVTDLGEREPQIDRSLKGGLDALTFLCRENNQAINCIFSNHNFKHLTTLINKGQSSNQKNYNLMTKASFIVKLFGKPLTLYILEKNDKMFTALLDGYKTLLDSIKLLEKDSLEGLGELANSDNAEALVALIVYNRLFRRILKNSQQKSFKFHLQISRLISSETNVLLKALTDPSVQFSALFESSPEAHKKIDRLLGLTGKWFELDPSERLNLVFEALHSSLALIFESIRKVYTQQTYDDFAGFFDGNGLTSFMHLANSRYGLRLFKVVMRLYGAIVVFPQNHLLDRVSLLVNVNGAMIEEYLRAQDTRPKIFEHVLQVAERLQPMLEAGLEAGLQNNLLGGFLPLVFKLFSGLLTHFTEDKFKEFKKTQKIKYVEYASKLVSFVLEVKKAFEKKHGEKTVGLETNIFISSFKALNDEKSPMYFFQETLNPEIDSFRRAGYELVDLIIGLYLYDESKVPQISEFVRYNYYDFEKSTVDVMKQKLEFLLKFRHEFQTHEEKKAVLWDRKRKYIEAFAEMQEDTNAQVRNLYQVIKNFDFELPDEENLRFINTPNLKSEGYIVQGPRSNILQVQSAWLKSPKNAYISSALLYVKERYKFMKAYFLENTNNNQIFIVFRLEDVIKRNVQLFIDYFFHLLRKMDLSFSEAQNNFFTNDFYFSIFILMDNLIRTSQSYRASFFATLKSESNTEVIEKLWSLHRLLLGYSLYSTFLDSAWQIIFTHYYLISNFLQNLCEDNFYKFKVWFFKGSEYKDSGSSLLEVYFAFLETAFKNTELPQYTREQLSLSDKPELFFVYDRLIEGMTEFINGGRTLGSELVYQKRIDIWVGIVMRIIENVDATFYVLKYNVLLYLQATLECSDPKIAEFVASNFSVSRTFRLVVRLLKKLFIRQQLLKKAKRAKLASSGTDMISVINFATENSVVIESVDVLMDYYKKYDETFSDHVIMNTLVGLYSFIRQMAQVVVRYKNFLDEINSIEHTMYVENKRFINENYDTESMAIWHFLKSIIVEMEIIYFDNQAIEEDSKNPEQEIDDNNIPLKKITHHFKKLPVCYFLTQSVKDNFMFYVSIDSTDIKHDEFFDKSRQFIFAMRNLRSLYKKSKIIFYISTEEAFRYYMIFLYLLGVTINILFLILYREDDKIFFRWDQLKIHKSVTGIAFINAGIAVICLILWFMVKHPTIKKIKWEEHFLVNPRVKPDFKTILKVSYYRATLKKKQFRTFLFHIVFSLLGIFVSPFFFSFLLLMIVDLSFLVYSVVISFVNNYDKLAYTLLMIIVVINFFAYIASDFYEEDFGNNPDLKNFCVTYFTCLINSINSGLRSGSGLAGNLPLADDNHSPKFEGRFFFDIMFFILVNIFLLGMFFGIIVDSFKEYRNKLEEKANDEENICFTCGSRKDVLEKRGEDFSEHVKRHDIWNYLFYIIYLEWKPFNSYDGIDLYINERIEKNKRREWMPIEGALEEYNERFASMKNRSEKKIEGAS